MPYQPLEGRAGFKMAMGLRPLEVAAWLEVDERREAELAMKTDLLEHSRDAVVATRPVGLAPSAELLAEVVAWLGAYRPDLARDVDPDEHPIVVASRLVQEDLCVMVRSDAWRLEAASVCFPSRWTLAQKIGTTLDEIHGPIPGYDVALARPTNLTFDRLSPEKGYWRLNWTLLDKPDLHQPESHRDSVEHDVDEWYFRVERQTIRSLPDSRAVVFTIRTYVAGLVEMAATHEGFVETVSAAIEAAPAAMIAYKGWRGVVERLRRD
jgi:hypothetical protein